MAVVWVYAEITPDGPKPTTLELLTKARSLGDDAAAKFADLLAEAKVI